MKTNETGPLGDALARIRDEASPEGRALYDQLVKALAETGAVAQALKAGDRFPDFLLANAEGRLVSLRDVLAQGIAVINFYRGAWCPWCSAQLKALARVAPEIKALGSALVAITPEAGGIALRTKFDNGLDYEILCDLDNTLALECGIVFRVPDALKQRYQSKGIDFPRIYGNGSWLLPTPATFIVGRDEVILHAHVDPDFRHRLEPAHVLDVLKALPR